MLSRERRISKGLFAQILKEGRNFNGQNISLRVTEQKESEEGAFSFVVSSKIAPKAVERNLLKRRARSIIKKYLKSIKGGCYCVFFFKKGALGLNFTQLEAEMLNSVKQARLLQ